MSDIFDVVVVGGGMIGSGAARHLAEAGHRVAVIAATEPDDWATADGPFASHYDEARVTRITDASETWATAAKRSIDRYAEIARRSGIDFYLPTGMVYSTLDAEAAASIARRLGADVASVDADWVQECHGVSLIEPDVPTVFEASPAGAVRPRRLAEAQLALTTAAGGSVVRETVVGVGASRGLWTATTGSGHAVTGERMLLATGAHGALVAGIDLDIERRLRTVTYGEVDEAVDVPSIIVDDVGRDDVAGVYSTPPLRWPDGRRMYKIGGDQTHVQLARDSGDIVSWFNSGGSQLEADALREVAEELLPEVDFVSWGHKPCVVAATPTGLPYIGWVDEGLAVAFAGNGGAAKSGDEWGRIAANLVTHQPADELITAELLTPVRRSR